MTTKDPAAPSVKAGFKERAKEEFKSFLVIALYLAFFFCALSTYSALLLRKYDVDYWNYALALINAFVIGKVILLGEMMHLGRRFEHKPLYQSVLYKSLVFGLLVFCFHLLEEFVKRLIHQEPAGTVLRNINFEDLVARTIVIFGAFIPLFAFREIGRVMGEEKLHALFFKPGAATNPALSATKS